MYIRHMQQNLLELSKDWSVISVTGPRQSGKTTLCKMTFPSYDYINLESTTTRMLVEEDTEAYLNQFTHGVIIDEAQLVPKVFSAIQLLVDAYPDRRFILSGSSDFLLMQQIAQSLAGRVAVRRLLPLSLRELQDDANCSLDELMWKGFFPSVWGTHKKPNDVYDSYISTYIQRDVRMITNIGDLDSFRRFLLVCATRVSGEWNALSIANEIAVSHVTIKRWMSILETSYTAFCLYPFFRNIGKRLSKTPKVYFYDVGLLCKLLGITSPIQLAHHPLRGAIFENMVVVEMLKQRFNNGLDNNLYFYRDKSGVEIDIIAENPEGIWAYEVKSSESLHPIFFKNLKSFRQLLPQEVKRSAVIYNGTEQLLSAYCGVIPFRHMPSEIA